MITVAINVALIALGYTAALIVDYILNVEKGD